MRVNSVFVSVLIPLWVRQNNYILTKKGGGGGGGGGVCVWVGGGGGVTVSDVLNIKIVAIII